jgi:hypothetical protein
METKEGLEQGIRRGFHKLVMDGKGYPGWLMVMGWVGPGLLA